MTLHPRAIWSLRCHVIVLGRSKDQQSVDDREQGFVWFFFPSSEQQLLRKHIQRRSTPERHKGNNAIIRRAWDSLATTVPSLSRIALPALVAF